MNQPHLSTTAVGIVLVVVAAGFYGLVKLYGARMDEGKVKAREDDND